MLDGAVLEVGPWILDGSEAEPTTSGVGGEEEGDDVLALFEGELGLPHHVPHVIEEVHDPGAPEEDLAHRVRWVDIVRIVNRGKATESVAVALVTIARLRTTELEQEGR